MPQQNGMVKKPEEFDVYKWDGTEADAFELVKWMLNFYSGVTRLYEVIYHNPLDRPEGDGAWVEMSAGLFGEGRTRLREGEIIMHSRETGRWSKTHEVEIERKFTEAD